MNPLARIIPTVAIIIATTFFSSCYKIYDYVKQHPGAEVNACRVKMLYEGNDTVFIHYNAYGDPIDMIRHPGYGGTWQSDKVFRYDSQHRLTDYLWANKGSDYRLIWHRYGYPRKSIVTDSLFTYLSNGGGPNPPPGTSGGLTIDSLDAEGRIVKSVQDPNSQYEYVTNYVYNAKGNIELPYALYDSKLSILHTSKVWMFLYADYSVNNRLNRYGGEMKVTSYNQAGLPLDFTIVPGDHGSDIIFVSPNHKLMVAYDCN